VERIVSQVAYPVRWDKCMATMAALGVSAFIELLPGGTLAGMAKRALPGTEILAIKSPDQLDAAQALVAAHSTANQEIASHGAADHGITEHNGLKAKEA
jgi:[acyl-carrier-protein] S-malonyltransferase